MEKSIDGVLGIWIQDHLMEGADESTELWWPPSLFYFVLKRLPQEW